MFKNLKTMISVILTLIFIMPMGIFADTTPIEWLKFDEGYSKIFSDKKPMLVYFSTRVCGWCRKMEKNTFADPGIIKLMKDNFVLSGVDLRSFEEVKWDGETFTERDIASMFRVVGVPCVAFMDTTGQLIIKIPGFLPPQDFQNVLKYVSGYWYENLTFEEYMRSEELLKQEGTKK